MIVKIQAALFPPNAPALIYDQSRTRQQVRDHDADTRRVLAGRVKAFCDAAWDAERKHFTLGAIVTDPEW